MPLVDLFDIKDNRVGIWHITESADYLLSQMDPGREELDRYGEFSHDLRKRQWLAYHLVVKQLIVPLRAELRYDIHGKPFLISKSHQISVSHTGEYAAAICNRNSAVGIDIEKMKERVIRVKERFLNMAELEQLGSCSNLETLYIYWCGKEALYKLNGMPDVDLKNDIHIHAFDYLCHTNGTCYATMTTPGVRKKFMLNYRKFEDYMLVVAM
ncbi:MAG: 4'-phosphopantetheinyl transferase superfamily protein [Bacteroidales bacterium]|jgi:phosphopantetheinyl transferase|nr:4'-phosphopantetheinyl transferase superfamily protein [Bacteroidales bacterium]